MVFNQLCPPALIYLIFSITQVIIDSVKGLYNTALMKIWVAILFTILLNYLCTLGLGTISWLIVFIPFILMTLVVAILLLMFGLDPSTGKLKIEEEGKNENKKRKHHKHHKHSDRRNNDTIGPGDPMEGDIGSIDNNDNNDNNDNIDKTTLGYFNSDDSSGGLDSGVGSKEGSSKTEDAKKESKQEKTDRILTRSILFYSEDLPNDKDGMLGKKKGDDDLIGATNVENDANSFDTNNIKIFIEDQTNLIYGMGEHEIASWYKTTALECINNLEGSTKEKQDKVNICLKSISDEVISKFPSLEKQNRLSNNLLHRYCPEAKTDTDCSEIIKKNWLKFD